MQNDPFARRASVRDFTGEGVSDTAVRQLLEAAVLAPSAGNCQPWHFYVVTDPNLRKTLCAYAYGQAFLLAAPVTIVVCAEPDRSARRYGERGRALYCLQDTAAAVENILLAAAAQGLGGCWVGAFDEEGVRSALSLPKGRRPVALLAIGHPGGKQSRPKRRALGDVVTYV